MNDTLPPPTWPNHARSSLSLSPYLAVASVMRLGEGLTMTYDGQWLTIEATEDEKTVSLIINQTGLPAFLAELQRLLGAKS